MTFHNSLADRSDSSATFGTDAGDWPGANVASNDSATESTLRQQGRQRAISQIAGIVLEASDLETLLSDVANSIANALDVDHVAVLQKQRDVDGFYFQGGVGWPDGVVGRCHVSADVRFLSGYALISCEPVFADDLKAEARFEPDAFLRSNDIPSDDFVSAICIRVEGQAHPFGLLGVYSRRRGAFSRDDVSFLQLVSSLFTTARLRSTTEETLEANDANYRTMFQALPDLVVVVDRSGRCLDSLAHPGDILPLECNGLVGQNVFETLSWQGAAQYVQLALESGDIRSHEFESEVDGETRCRDIRIVPQGAERAMLVVRDVTRRHRSEKRFRELVESAPDAMVIADLGGTITLVNTQTERMFGWTRSELVGQPVEVLLPKSYRQAHREHFSQYMRSPEIRPLRSSLELLGVRKGGAEFPVEVSICPIDGEHQSLAVAAVRDVTERKKSAQLLRDRETALAHAGRLSTLGTMVAGISHEIKQPLHVISTYATACRSAARLPESDTIEKLAEWTEQIAEEAKRAGDIVSRLKRFARKGEMRCRRVDLVAVVREAVQLATFETRDRHLVRIESSDVTQDIAVDRVQIQQVLVNLLHNAFEAMEAVPLEARLATIRVKSRDDEVEVSVSDTGCGLSPLTRDRLFEPFVTSKRHGLGVGLAISRSIVEAHGGKLWVSSNERGGATFSFAISRHLGVDDDE